MKRNLTANCYLCAALVNVLDSCPEKVFAGAILRYLRDDELSPELRPVDIIYY